MKRLLLQIGAMLFVAILGVVAIAQAQRSLRAKEPPRTRAQAVGGAQQSAARLLDKTAKAAQQNPQAATPSTLSASPARTTEQQPLPKSSNTAPVAYDEPMPFQEVPPEELHGTINDGHVLQAVSEAELSPTPDAQFEFAPEAEPTEEEYRQWELDEAARTQLESHDDNHYVPHRMSQQASAHEAPATNPSSPSPWGEPTPAEPQHFRNTPAALGSDADYSAAPQSAAASSLPQAGTGRPGSRDLEGMQAAALTVEKVAPADLQVGRNAVFEIRVRNTGTATAKEVQVIDEVPARARLASTTPFAEQGARGELVWNVGRLAPGEEATVSMEIIPLEEGEIGSVAIARFAAEASARSVATRPQLTLQVSGPREVLIGEEARLIMRVANVGSGAASNVVLLNQLPPQLSHPAGSEVEYSVGLLGPNESREIELNLMASKPGQVENIIVAMGEGNLRADDRVQLEVLAPALDVTIEGSERRFLERQAAYTLTLFNSGTAPARNIDLTARLPQGLQFVEANNLGEYDASSRSVHWRLEELPAGESGSVTLVTMPVGEGEHQLQVEAKSGDGLTVQKSQRALIEGIAGVSFEVLDVSDPIEVGGTTAYEIRVINQGTKAASNVRVAALLPAGMQPVEASGPVAHILDGGQVVFEPLARLAPKADTTYQVRVRAQQQGDMRVRVQLLSDEMQTPVTKEESTRVFGNE